MGTKIVCEIERCCGCTDILTNKRLEWEGIWYVACSVGCLAEILLDQMLATE